MVPLWLETLPGMQHVLGGLRCESLFQNLIAQVILLIPETLLLISLRIVSQVTFQETESITIHDE